VGESGGGGCCCCCCMTMMMLLLLLLLCCGGGGGMLINNKFPVGERKHGSMPQTNEPLLFNNKRSRITQLPTGERKNCNSGRRTWSRVGRDGGAWRCAAAIPCNTSRRPQLPRPPQTIPALAHCALHSTATSRREHACMLHASSA